MSFRRREFLAADISAGVAAGQLLQPAAPIRNAKVTKLLKTPDVHPNALDRHHSGQCTWVCLPDRDGVKQTS